MVYVIQFEDETFDAIVDKGGLDALMEPELGPQLGEQYLSEVVLDFLLCFIMLIILKLSSGVIDVNAYDR